MISGVTIQTLYLLQLGPVDIAVGPQVLAHPVLRPDFRKGILPHVRRIAIIVQSAGQHAHLRRRVWRFEAHCPLLVKIYRLQPGQIIFLVSERIVLQVPTQGAAVHILLHVQQLQHGALRQVRLSICG